MRDVDFLKTVIAELKKKSDDSAWRGTLSNWIKC